MLVDFGVGSVLGEALIGMGLSIVIICFVLVVVVRII